jgi:hypothetical protein
MEGEKNAVLVIQVSSPRGQARSTDPTCSNTFLFQKRVKQELNDWTSLVTGGAQLQYRRLRA